MPPLVAALLGGLIEVAGTLVGKVLISLGISAITYTGISTSIAFCKAQLLAGISGLPAEAIGIAATMKVGVCISILTSALVARMTLKGLTGDTLKRFVKQ